ncbi:MAG: HNH/ENDO VII family nuclease [Lachnospiraceae bacterium]|nr:HNH/ENDO VII family nuclease [Lachnospiraceae bacterium]
MKRIMALVLVCCLLLSACSQDVDLSASSKMEISPPTGSSATSQGIISDLGEPDFSEDTSTIPTEFHTIIPDYNNLNDPALLGYVEDSVYEELVKILDDSYFVQNVDAVYVSKEYLEEVSYNSKTNIFFGYTLAELDEQFQGTRYVFTLSDEGETTVEPFEEYDDTYERAIKNVAVGSGVILICVTVSVVSGGIGAPAISMIFAASAKTGSIMALSSGGIGALASGIVTGVQTQDFDEAVKAAALASSEGFKWGAISGTISGGISEAVALKGATLNGLTMDEAAILQREGYPLDVIKEFRSMEQYNICKEAGLSPQMVNGNTALIRDIDLDFVDEMGRTNLERMQQGLAALDPATGGSYQLHHVGQRADSTLAILKRAEHMQGGNNTIWHELGEVTQVHGAGSTWDAQRQAFWKALADSLS